jgi:hypothetical protein
MRPELGELPWASDTRRAKSRIAPVPATSCCCGIRMTNSSTFCRRCLKRLRPPKTLNRRVRTSPAFCRSRRKMPGFARLRSGYRTFSATSLPARGRMPRDLVATGRSRRKPLKPLRAGMPGDPGATVVTTPCAFYTAHGTAGATGTRHSPRPLRGRKINANLGRIAPRECELVFPHRRPGLEPGPIITGVGCCAKALVQPLSKQATRRGDERNRAHAGVLGVRRDDSGAEAPSPTQDIDAPSGQAAAMR